MASDGPTRVEIGAVRPVGYVLAMTFLVPARFCGPPESGNGGWVSGHAAALFALHPDQAVTVRLRNPPPLDRAMTVSRSGDRINVVDGEHLVLEATLDAPPGVTPDATLGANGLPGPVSWEDAEAAAEGYEGAVDHPFPTCFSCGTARATGDGLRLRPGRVPGGTGEYACPWTPAEDVDLETVWAALDCPGGWASGIAGRPMVLGTMTARIRAMPAVGQPHVVVAWQRGSSGRKHLSGTALYAAGGQLLAHAEATWIAVDPDTIRPLGGTP